MLMHYKENNKISLIIEDNWHNKIPFLKNETEFYSEIKLLIDQVFSFGEENYLNLTEEIFKKIVRIGQYASNNSWAVIIDTFHTTMLTKHLDPSNYAANMLYKGTGYVNLPMLLKVIQSEIRTGSIKLTPSRLNQFQKFVHNYHVKFS